MADESDSIQIDLKSDLSEGERARKKLAEIEAQTKELRSSFEGGNVSLARFNQELRNLTGQATRAQAALDKIRPPTLEGPKRASAKFQLGLAGANIAQDVIQGGPAAGVNNILGLAGNNSVRALGGEFVAAAGGAKVLAAAFGTIAVAATASFLAIDTGLKSNKLGWSDLGDVIDEMSGGAISSVGGGIGGAISEVWDGVKHVVGSVADVTIGWNAAAGAVRSHKDEVDRATASAEAYAKASKTLSGIKSEGQEENEGRGKLFGRAAAGLEKGGIGDFLDQLAIDVAKKQGNARTVYDRETAVLDEKGNPTGKTRTEKVTGAMLAREALAQDLAKAAGGDFNAQESIRSRAAAAGYDPAALDAAMSGRDPKAEAKEAEKKAKDDAREADKRADELAKPLQERFNNLSAEGGGKTPDRAGVVRQLVKGGVKPEEAEAVADSVLKNLQDGYADEIRKRAGAKGTDAKGAAADLLKDAADKRQKEADQAEAAKEKKRREATEKAEKLTGGTALDSRVDGALLREALKSGGAPGVASKEVTERLVAELKSRGMGEDEARLAAGEIVSKHARKLGDQVNEGAMEPRKMDAPQHIDGADFARSVESAGAAQGAKLLENSEAMKERLTDLVRIASKGARLS